MRRRHIPEPGWWLLAFAFGYMAVHVLAYATGTPVDDAMYAAGWCIGIAVGAAAFLALCYQITTRR